MSGVVRVLEGSLAPACAAVGELWEVRIIQEEVLLAVGARRGFTGRWLPVLEWPPALLSAVRARRAASVGLVEVRTTLKLSSTGTPGVFVARLWVAG